METITLDHNRSRCSPVKKDNVNQNPEGYISIDIGELDEEQEEFRKKLPNGYQENRLSTVCSRNADYTSKTDTKTDTKADSESYRPPLNKMFRLGGSKTTMSNYHNRIKPKQKILNDT